MLQLICLGLAFSQVGEEEKRIGTYKVSQTSDSITRLNCLTKANILHIQGGYFYLKCSGAVYKNSGIEAETLIPHASVCFGSDEHQCWR